MHALNVRIFSYEYLTLRLHFKSHQGSKSRACYRCEKIFIRIFDLGLHFKTHQGSRSRACYKCEKILIMFDLGLHLKTHQESESRAFYECEEIFIRVSYLGLYFKTQQGISI